MGGVIACICCYCCLTTLKPTTIEIMALICNVIEIGCLIWGAVDIPWDYLNTGGKVMYAITCVVIVITLILLLILMCLRCGNKINNSKNQLGICLCITMIVFDVLGLILVIISEIIILSKMFDVDDVHYHHRRGYSNGIFEDHEWAAAFISMSATEVCTALHFICGNFLLKLIQYKTDKCYAEYMGVNNADIIRTVEVVNRTDSNPNQLNFIGYDQNGHPIYSGNQQYVLQNPIVVNNNADTTNAQINN